MIIKIEFDTLKDDAKLLYSFLREQVGCSTKEAAAPPKEEAPTEEAAKPKRKRRTKAELEEAAAAPPKEEAEAAAAPPKEVSRKVLLNKALEAAKVDQVKAAGVLETLGVKSAALIGKDQSGQAYNLFQEICGMQN